MIPSGRERKSFFADVELRSVGISEKYYFLSRYTEFFKRITGFTLTGVCRNSFIAVCCEHDTDIGAVFVHRRKHLTGDKQIVIFMRDYNHDFFVLKLRIIEAVIYAVV